MIHIEQRSDAVRLLRDGWSDEAVERLTALTLPQVIELRAEAAAARPFFYPPNHPAPSPSNEPRKTRPTREAG